MQFHAASIGSAVPQENFNATIQSVFDSSLNLRLDHEDRLITILISDHYDLPQGIRLESRNGPLPSLTVGLRAASRGGVLRFDSSPLNIDLRGVPIWNGNITALTPSFKKAWLTTWRILNEQQRLKETELIADNLFQLERGPLLTRRLRQPVLQLIVAAERFDSRASTDAAQKMIGLGPGVTPSGDDVLIGFLAGLHSTVASIYERQAFIRAFGDAILLLSKATNDISRTYLYHAVRGEFSSSIVKLVNAICDGEEQQLLSAATNAMRVGHSSGMDSVTGLLIGLALWGASSSYSDYEELSLWQLRNE